MEEIRRGGGLSACKNFDVLKGYNTTHPFELKLGMLVNEILFFQIKWSSKTYKSIIHLIIYFYECFY